MAETEIMTETESTAIRHQDAGPARRLTRGGLATFTTPEQDRDRARRDLLTRHRGCLSRARAAIKWGGPGRPFNAGRAEAFWHLGEAARVRREFAVRVKGAGG